MKALLRRFVPTKVREIRNLVDRAKPIHQRDCPICGYHGFFANDGRPIRPDARCPNCRSLERHRLFWLWFKENTDILREPVLHFAPEPVLRREFSKMLNDYMTADLYRDCDVKLDIEDVDRPSGTVRTVICNHVLEHVDDKKALSEIRRILSDDGKLIVSVPIVEGWEETYENPEITDPQLRELHFGQSDHVRFYGRDFRSRLETAGFADIETITASGENVVTYSLLRGEKFFVCSKR